MNDIQTANLTELKRHFEVPKVKVFSKDDARAFLDAWVALREQLRAHGVVDFDAIRNGERVAGSVIVIDAAGAVHRDREVRFQRVTNDRGDARFSVSTLNKLIPIGAQVAYFVAGKTFIVVDLNARGLDEIVGSLVSTEVVETATTTVSWVDVEMHETDSFTVALPESKRTHGRREQPLVQRLEEYLRDAGHEVGRWQISIAGEPAPIYCDIYDRSTKTLIESKSDALRRSIRMAIGQLYDYGRHVDANVEKHRRAVLLPTQPSADLGDLLLSLSIDVIWPVGDGFDSTEPSLLAPGTTPR